MSKLTKFSILLTGASLCAVLIGCQQGTEKKSTDKAAMEKKAEQPKEGAKSESTLEKTKEKAQEISEAAKEKAKEVGAATKEKTQEITGSKDKSADTSGKDTSSKK